MKKLPILIVTVCFFLVASFSCQNQNQNQQTLKPYAELLKEKLDSAEMKVFCFNEGPTFEVDYPECFTVEFDSNYIGSVRFSFNENDVRLSLTHFIEPNTEGWSLREAMDSLSGEDSLNKELGDGFYMLEGTLNMEGKKVGTIEKCFLVGGYWINYTFFYYPATYKTSVMRIIEMIRKWEPRVKELEKMETMIC